MKFYFPDSQDLVSPTYDFDTDEYSPLRVRQRDDRYAHEVLLPAPYDGLLVSKAIVDGSTRGAGKYSMPQRERLYRFGVRRFFRLPDHVSTLGDCGAFNYVNEEEPPYTVDEVLDFYSRCGFDAGISVDHVILSYLRSGKAASQLKPQWQFRQQLTLKLAARFLDRSSAVAPDLQPVGAAQGWSPESYASSVDALQAMGYKRIALGGMVPLKTPDIIECLKAISSIKSSDTELHLLGVTRLDSIATFAAHGVTSFDSTSPFRQAFMDDKDNYHTRDTTYVAIRVPQVDGNPALKRAILAGKVAQEQAIRAERHCLQRLRAFDEAGADVLDVIDALADYENVLGVPSKHTDYRRTLEAAPWRACRRSLCKQHGIQIAIFRGTERNKRRGFHNLSVFAAKMHLSAAVMKGRQDD